VFGCPEEACDGDSFGSWCVVATVPCRKSYPYGLATQVIDIVGPYVEWMYCANLRVPPPSTPPSTPPPPSTPALVSVDILLRPGWSFVAFNALPTDASLDALLGTNATFTRRILTQGAAAEFVPGFGWVGSLASVGVSVTRLYKIFSETGGVLAVVGTPPARVEYTLNIGYTWIGVPLTVPSIAVEDFLPGTWQPGDRILGSGVHKSARFFSGLGWVGELTRIYAGVGYKVYKSVARTIEFEPL